MKLSASLALSAGAAVALAQSCSAPDSAPGKWYSQEWEAIVVGAGTAGIIVADRLSEAGLKTLLLEQGGPSYGITGGQEKPEWFHGADANLSRVDVPGLYSTIFSGKSSLLCKPDVVNAFQACTIGGNSAINAGLYFQPPASDWDDHHPQHWHSADVQPAVRSLLQRQPAVTNYSADGQYYLQSGYEAVRKWIVDDANFTQVSLADEPNNKDRVFGRTVYNYIEGQRGGPVRTYLQSALRRANFHFQSGVRVHWVQRKDGTATGVLVDSAADHVVGQTVPLSRNGRVVLSAGAILSPQLLMYSGVGPRETLAKLAEAKKTPYSNDSWIVQPSVGEGLFDNPNTFIELAGPDVTSYTYKYDNPIPEDRDMWLSSRSGPYAFASQTSAFWGYVPNPDGPPTGVQGTVNSAGYADHTGNDTITLNIYGTSGLLSSGRVVLSDDGNFTAGPSSGIYYSNPRDADNIASFIHSIFQKLPHSTPDSRAREGLTPLNLAQNSTIKEIRDYITKPSAYAVGAVQHWSSSCRIGQCVDANTKVIGTENLHVIDASILSPLTVNPQFGAMVAAELGAARILNPLKL